MDTKTLLEMVGYLASFLVLVSLLMTSVVKLRIINTVGSLIFTVYAILISSYPTAVMNFCLVGVNLYYLIRMAKTEQVFTLLPAAPGDAFVGHFLRFYRHDIAKYFQTTPSADQADTVFLVCRDASPAGILMGRRFDGDSLEVSLDYSVPQYRDCSVGRFLYRQLADRGFRTLVVAEATPDHGKYLEKMGFVQKDGRYVKELA